MYETRFSQSFGSMPNKTKFFNTTKSSLNKTQQRLPQLNRSFSSSTAKNAKQKLESLDEKVQDLSKKVLDLRLQTRVKIINNLRNQKDFPTSSEKT